MYSFRVRLALLVTLSPLLVIALPLASIIGPSAEHVDVVFMTLGKRDSPASSPPNNNGRLSGDVIKYIVIFSLLFALLLGALYWLRKARMNERPPRQPTRIVIVPTTSPSNSRPNLFLFAPRGQADPTLRGSPSGATRQSHSNEEHSQYSTHSLTSISQPPPAYHPTTSPASHGVSSDANGV